MPLGKHLCVPLATCFAVVCLASGLSCVSDAFYRVLQEYYVSHQLSDSSPSAISWIGSLQVFALFSGALLGGPLFDRYGAKVSCKNASIISPKLRLELTYP